jgi:hypothetical protein
VKSLREFNEDTGAEAPTFRATHSIILILIPHQIQRVRFDLAGHAPGHQRRLAAAHVILTKLEHYGNLSGVLTGPISVAL